MSERLFHIIQSEEDNVIISLNDARLTNDAYVFPLQYLQHLSLQ